MKKLQASGVPLEGIRVLIIEDDAMLAQCVGETIESAGYSVVGVAGTIADALSKINAIAFDIALLDLHLHGRTVEALSSAIVKCGASAVVSTGADFGSVPAELRLWPVLRKPYKDAELLAALAIASRSMA